MKKRILFLFALMVASLAVVSAQGKGGNSKNDAKSEVVSKQAASGKKGGKGAAAQAKGAKAVKGAKSSNGNATKVAAKQQADKAEGKGVVKSEQVRVVSDEGQSNGYLSPLRWYVGAGGGVSFAQSAFVSISKEDIELGYNGRIFGGYKFSHLLSLEASFGYQQVTGNVGDCCSNYYIYNGKKYYSPLYNLGDGFYSYKDIKSISNIYSLGVSAPINVMGNWAQFSNLHFLVIPSLSAGYVSSYLEAKDNESELSSDTSVIFGAGADLAVAYDINRQFTVRLQSGVSGFYGGIDAAPDSHKLGYFWNSSLNLIYKLPL